MTLKAEDVLVDVLNLDAEIKRCARTLAEMGHVPPGRIQDWRTQTRAALLSYLSYLTARRAQQWSLLKALDPACKI